MNRYQKENAAWLVHGYFLPRADQRDAGQEVYSRAKSELIGHLRQQIADVEALAFDEFSAVVRLPH